MQSVDLYDELNISVTEKDFELICDAPDLKTDETNLVTKAARFLLSTYNIKHGLKIELAKKIPIGAGLAGGSTDCAAALIGINKLFHLNIPFEEMIKIGQAFGADVPFCLTGGTAITEGTGEIITPLPPLPPCFIVIACPSIHVSTAEIFNKLAIDSDKVKTLDKAKILDDLQNFHFYNIFTPVTSVLHPEISDLISQLRRLGARGAEMSGTGSSVFAYFKDEKSAVKALNIIGESVKNVFICKPVEGKGIFNE